MSTTTMFTFAVVAVLFCLANCDSSAKGGLKCVELGDANHTSVCTGTNKNYLDAREKARKDKAGDMDIQTRFFHPPCSGQNGCTAFQATYAPTFMQNKFGQDRYIYQDEDFGFSQSIRVVTCNAGPCGFRSHCQQKYREYWLVAWDPTLIVPLPLVDVFSVPDCCGCSRH